jgi:hypothetical protein
MSIYTRVADLMSNSQLSLRELDGVDGIVQTVVGFAEISERLGFAFAIANLMCDRKPLLAAFDSE